MGRQVIHNSPDQHPQQGDAMTPDQMDQMIEQAAKNSTGTYSNQRQLMKPMQTPQPRDTTNPSSTLDYLKSLMPGGGKK
jgi:hypothetical protein